MRDFGAIGKAEGARLTPEEFEIATGLVEKLSSADFDPEACTDEYRERVERMLNEKVKGQEITRRAEGAGTRQRRRSLGGAEN